MTFNVGDLVKVNVDHQSLRFSYLDELRKYYKDKSGRITKFLSGDTVLIDIPSNETNCRDSCFAIEHLIKLNQQLFLFEI